MPTPSIPQLSWASLTAAVNEMKSPNQFLKKLIFGTHDAKSTEQIEVDVLVKARETAPMVRKNGMAILVGGYSEQFQVVEAPNIRIKRELAPSDLMFSRQAGTPVFPTPQQQRSSIDFKIGKELKVLADYMTNSEEYLCAMALRGQIAYSIADQEVFQITFPRAGGNVIALTTFWDDPDPSLPTPELDFHLVKQILSNAVGLAPTDVILGTEAAAAFLTLIKKQHPYGLQTPGLTFGSVDFAAQFTTDGAIFHGVYSGVRVWEYIRTASVDGVATPMIRSKYAEFVCVDPAAEFVLYYGAIADMDAYMGGAFATERFSKSRLEWDPSVWSMLSHTRPLPCPRRPNAMLSAKVVYG